MGFLKLFARAGLEILLISPSWVARIPGMSHHTGPYNHFSLLWTTCITYNKLYCHFRVICVCVCVCFTGAWAWIQGLHLEPLHQPCFCEGFFKIVVSQIVCPGWLWTQQQGFELAPFSALPNLVEFSKWSSPYLLFNWCKYKHLVSSEDS
jgi:hypothetical protein